jgi:hypothetical protein
MAAKKKKKKKVARHKRRTTPKLSAAQLRAYKAAKAALKRKTYAAVRRGGGRVSIS